MRHHLRSVATVLVVGGLLPAVAEATEYRLLSTADDRVIPCRVLATEAAGLRVALPQGEMLVPFTLLRDMVPISESQYQAQNPWLVYIPADSEYRDDLVASVAAIPSAHVVGEPGTPPVITPQATARLQDCGSDMSCVAQESRDSWLWVVSASSEAGQVTVRGSVSSGKTNNTSRPDSVDSESISAAVAEVMEISPGKGEPIDTKPPKGPRGPKKPKGTMTRERVLSLSMAPVPGLPSLMQDDMAGFGLAWAAVVPTTALWVGAVGDGAQSAPEHILLGLAGFYAATVITNQALGLRTFNRAEAIVAVEPARVGQGASVSVTVPL